MAFSNQNSSIITDSMGNLYNFLLDDGGITLIYFNKLMGNVEKNIVAKNCQDEFHSIIDQNDNVYLIFQEKDGDLKLLSFIKGVKQSETINTSVEGKAYNLRIIDDYEELHGFYCVADKINNGQFIAYHCNRRKNKWTIEELEKIRIYDILNPFEAVIIKDDLFLGYYDIVDGVEQLFVKSYDLSKRQWNQRIQLTSSPSKKLYLDILEFGDNIHITYSEAFEGNYIIKYQCFRLIDGKVHLIHNRVLSNPSNCSHPTLILHGNKLWNSWIEHDSVISAFSNDDGNEWSEPYLWNESKTDIFSRYIFSSNEAKVKRTYNLNYSYGKQYPDISFLGFGSLNNTTRVPMKKKEDSTKESKQELEEKKGKDKEIVKDYKEQDMDDIYSTFYSPIKSNSKNPKLVLRDNKRLGYSIEDFKKDIDKLYKEIKEINICIDELRKAYKALHESDDLKDDRTQDEIKELSSRVEHIENYLRRRRGLFQR